MNEDVQCRHLLPSTIEADLNLVERRMAKLVLAAGHQDLHRFHGENAAIDQVSSGGGRMRARLALCAGHALGLSNDDSVAIATSAELLHNASLVHDDLQDGDRTRRGRDAVWVRYGVNAAICTGDLLLSASYASLASLSTIARLPALMTLMHQRVASAAWGQSADLSLQGRSFDDVPIYEAIATAKSGALISLPLELSLVATGQTGSCSQARRAANAFAVAYQIADDLEDAHRDRSLNLMRVLEEAGILDPQGFARGLAQGRLATAMREGASLPHRCGAVLVSFAECLSMRLIEEARP